MKLRNEYKFILNALLLNYITLTGLLPGEAEAFTYGSAHIAKGSLETSDNHLKESALLNDPFISMPLPEPDFWHREASVFHSEKSGQVLFNAVNEISETDRVNHDRRDEIENDHKSELGNASDHEGQDDTLATFEGDYHRFKQDDSDDPNTRHRERDLDDLKHLPGPAPVPLSSSILFLGTALGMLSVGIGCRKSFGSRIYNYFN
jgi:hypothetical protein